MDGKRKQTPRTPSPQQAFTGLVQGGKVRHGLKAQAQAQIRMIPQRTNDTAIVGLEKGLQDQTGKQLGLGVKLGAKAMGMGTQGLGANEQGLKGDTQRGFCKTIHILLDARSCQEISGFSTEQDGHVY
jgi:hypothetical protein